MTIRYLIKFMSLYLQLQRVILQKLIIFKKYSFIYNSIIIFS